MLTDLMVEGLGVIDRAELQLAPGSSALTGETGAGKTLVVAALGLLLGARSDRSIVREGARGALVDARFVVPASHPAARAAEEHGLLGVSQAADGCELILSRTVSSEKTKARVNQRLVTLSVLQDIARHLVEISGQHEQHGLVAPASQREILDTFAGTTELASRVAAAVEEMNRARAELEALRADDRDRERELIVLTHEISEIERADLQLGEVSRLEETARRLEHAETIASAIAGASQSLKGERGAGESLAAALAHVEELVQADPEAGDLAIRLRAASIEVADIADEIGRRGVTADPAGLAEIRERLAVLARLMKRFGPAEEDVLAHLATAKRRHSELDDSDLHERALEDEAEAATVRAHELAQELSDGRRRAIDDLEGAMASALNELALEGARFGVELEARDIYPGGLESVSFVISTNPGEGMKPLSKVASGGELSRISLALRLQAGGSTAPTLVFDEVDAGVGGQAARAVGRYLAALGQRPSTQVLVVTHLPQVAAAADHQFKVSKTVAGRRTVSSVAPVEGDERIEELSRMLAGLPDSDRGREHAQELLELSTREAGR